jgi:hypothetical protein
MDDEMMGEDKGISPTLRVKLVLLNLIKLSEPIAADLMASLEMVHGIKVSFA